MAATAIGAMGVGERIRASAETIVANGGSILEKIVMRLKAFKLDSGSAASRRVTCCRASADHSISCNQKQEDIS
jgi:hypothetical protein